jgi:hypothetical protein
MKTLDNRVHQILWDFIESVCVVENVTPGALLVEGVPRFSVQNSCM